MKWEGRKESDNVEDQRGAGGFGSGRLLAGGGGVIVLIIALLFGINPDRLSQFLGGGGSPNNNANAPAPAASPEEQKLAHFTKIILADTEKVWTDLFQKRNMTYEKPVLVMFTGRVQSACGPAESAMGPFYCPGDKKVYIDLAFYQELDRKLNAPGDFSHAYVVAHEVGHHVQRLLGYHVQDNSKEQSVRLELQADYLAGVWAHHAQERFHYLDPTDLETALKAAFEIGDDRLEKKAGVPVTPERFTHGSSKQRMKWFKKGFDTGDIDGAAALFKLAYKDL